jgi:hypothetical protein
LPSTTETYFSDQEGIAADVIAKKDAIKLAIKLAKEN